MSNDVLQIIPLSGSNNNNSSAQLILDVGDSAMLLNTSNTNTVWIGNNPSLTPGYQNAVPIQPLGYLVITAEDEPIYAVVATGITVNLALLPGGIAFFTPQLNATITGPVSITGTVNATIVGTPAVTISSGTVVASISGTVSVTFPSAQNVIVNSGTVTVSNTINTTVTNTPTVTVGSGNVTVAGTVNIGNSPAVTISSGTVVATISGTPTVTISGNVTFSNSTIDIIGTGGFILSGQTAQIFQNTGGAVSATPGTLTTFVANASVLNYNSLDCSFNAPTNSSAAAGSAICAVIQFEWLSANGNFIAIDNVSMILGSDITYSIPCKGAAVNISVFNVGTVGNVQFPTNNIIVDGNDRAIDDIIITAYTQTSHTFTGLTYPSNPPMPEPAGLIQGWVANIANLTGLVVADLYLIPLVPYNGQVQGWWQVITDALANDAVLIDLTNAVVGGIVAGTGNNALLLNLPSAIATAPLYLSYQSPPSQLGLVVKSTNLAGAVFLALTGKG